MAKHAQHTDHTHTSEANFKEYAKFYGVILAILAISGWLYGESEAIGAGEYLRYLMGVFLVVFAGFKLAGYKMFATMFAGYDLIAKRYPFYAKAYPFIELGLGLVYLADVLGGLRDWLALIIFGVGTIGVAQEIYHRRSGVYCACLGNIIKLPLSTVSLVEDVAMVGMALWMLQV